MSPIWPHTTLGDPRTGPAVIFLHGFLGQGRDWLPVAERLAPQYFCVLPDLPGHGRHTHIPLDTELSFENLSAGLASTLEALGLRRPVIVGYSLGGRTALHFACTRPNLLSALVLESVSPGLENAAERTTRTAQDDERAGKLLTGGQEAFVSDWYQAGLWASLQQRPDLLEQVIASRTAGDARWLAKVISELSPGRMKSLWDDLPGLSLPVLVLAGLLDTKYDTLAPRTAALIPNAQFIGIAEAGHNIHLEQPESFSVAVESFLQHFTSQKK